jgi:hypothetical protein
VHVDDAGNSLGADAQGKGNLKECLSLVSGAVAAPAERSTKTHELKIPFFVYFVDRFTSWQKEQKAGLARLLL